MRRRIGCLIVLLVLALIWVVEFAGGYVLLWSGLRCWCVDIDINSGDVRSREYLAEFCLAEIARGNEFSRVASEGTQAKPPLWRTSIVSAPLVPRPAYYAYQNASQQPGWLEALWTYGNFTPAAKRETARNVLLLWHRDKRSHSAHVYLSQLDALCMRRLSQPVESRHPIDTKDLPPLPPARK